MAGLPIPTKDALHAGVVAVSRRERASCQKMSATTSGLALTVLADEVAGGILPIRRGRTGIRLGAAPFLCGLTVFQHVLVEAAPQPGMVVFPPMLVQPTPTTSPPKVATPAQSVQGGMELFPPAQVTANDKRIVFEGGMVMFPPVLVDHVEPIITTSAPTGGWTTARANSSTPQVTAGASAASSEGSVQWWGWLLIAIAASLVIALFLLCCWLRFRWVKRALGGTKDEVVPFNKAVVPVESGLDDEAQLVVKDIPAPLQHDAQQVQLVVKDIPAPLQHDAQQGSCCAAGYYAKHLLPTLGAKDWMTCVYSPFVDHHRDMAERRLTGAVEGSSFAELESAIDFAKAKSVAEEPVWFAEVCRRRRVTVVELKDLVVGHGTEFAEKGDGADVRWNMLMGKKSSVLEDLLVIARTDPCAALAHVRRLVVTDKAKLGSELDSAK
eukprot:TRINITY_DN4462_c0_g1_i2.p1 TRINITY_DN4462_c0_g1~~TRINITY_DN4462_c0_g1_i2.p1  ORF type:complete len:439 (-),score=79.05 TRINITY_DN4462_c0_g1_i2:93-1409(-)